MGETGKQMNSDITLIWGFTGPVREGGGGEREADWGIERGTEREKDCEKGNREKEWERESTR